MPSPFPGMNPYLEQPAFWRDFHQSFAIYIRNALVPLVRPKYAVRVEERLYVSEWPHDEDGYFFGLSDVSVHDRNLSGQPDVPASTGTLVAPLQVTVDVPDIETGLNALEIVDRETNEIVTILEILSPSNKYAGEDRAAYMEKRAEILRTKANLVELDLLRGGPKLPANGMTKCDYHILISTPGDRPRRAGVWPFDLRDPIPICSVPLRSHEAAVQLDLKPLLDKLYDEADYGLDLYRSPPVPPLTPEDQAWADELLQSIVPA